MTVPSGIVWREAEQSSSTTPQMKSVTYQVRKPSGKPKGGKLNFSYKFGETKKYPYTDVDPVGTSAEYPPPLPPVSARYQPAPPPPPTYTYPAQQYPGNVYGGYPPSPPLPRYGYPPPPLAGYGYAQPQQPRNRNSLGLGSGAGLLGGVLRGLLIGRGGGVGDGCGF